MVEDALGGNQRLEIAALDRAAQLLVEIAGGRIEPVLTDIGEAARFPSVTMDFDLPDADNDKLRALEAGLNDLIRQDLPLRYTYVPLAEATSQHGLIRSRSVAPPPDDEGLIRIVEIVGLDRQACGGTHLTSTGSSRPVISRN